MNAIKQLYSSMTDDQLREALEEIRQSEATGLVGEIVRHWAKKSGDLTGGFTATDFFMTQINIMREAAYRWLDTQG